MPTKRNSAGNQQPYVPAGYGDASGEYAEQATGSNKHYADAQDTTRQLPYESDREKTYQEVKSEVLGTNSKVSNEMKNRDYTERFAEEVNISKKSLNDEELGEFNNYLEEIFNNYPEMQRFRDISVKNNSKSLTGGYIRTTENWLTGKKTYDLYINAGWLEYKDPKEEFRNKRQFFEDLVKSVESNENYTEKEKKFYRRAYQDNIDYYDKKLKDDTYSNVIERIKDRKGRLKNLMAHELMHRITQTFYGYDTNKYAGNVEKNNLLNARYNDIKQNITDTYVKAVGNGDALKISKYANSNKEEFLSEANSMIECGFKCPEYITNLINDIKTFLRSEK